MEGASTELTEKRTTAGRAAKGRSAAGYGHPEASAALRPDVGTQSQFRKKKKPVVYRYDSSLSPTLAWDGSNPAREQTEAKIAALQGGIARLVAMVEAGELSGSGLAAAKEALAAACEDADALKTLSGPFLDWAGKAERLSSDAPTLPLFVHERLSTTAIPETLKGHSRDRRPGMLDLFGESDLPIRDRLLEACEHRDGWVNRLRTLIPTTTGSASTSVRRSSPGPLRGRVSSARCAGSSTKACGRILRGRSARRFRPASTDRSR